MFTKTSAGYIFIFFLLATDQVLGRERWLERENRPVYLYPRRFGQEHPAVLQKLQDACPGQVCGNLAGQAVSTLLGGAAECAQQNLADAIINASRQFDAATQANMVAIAQEFRQTEKNTPPDFSTNPPINRNSVFCQTAPNNTELDGLVQAQDPANDPDIFFDPATQKSVRKGDQPNTFPFNGSASDSNTSITNSSATTTAQAGTELAREAEVSTSACPTAVTVSVSVTNPAAAVMTNAITVSVGQPSPTPAPTSSASPDGADFGSCSTPEIEFGAGFDGRTETSFQPVDPASFNHGSADNINIIAQFICGQLASACEANQAAQNLCTAATNAASSAPPGGAQADAFNAVFGITTNFASVATVDNQGNIVSGTGASSTGGINSFSSTSTATLTATATSTSSSTDTSATSSGDNPDFGSCSTPEIVFGAGFDGRKETSFEPANETSFNHGSAQNIDIITQFICDTLTNSCNANQAAKNLCAQATTAASNATPTGSGAQADAFNAVFGIQTNFASVQEIDNQGNPVGAASAGGSGSGGGSTTTSTPTTAPTTEPTATSATNFASDSPNLQKFTGALGGVQAPAVQDLGNGTFSVEGTNAPFNNEQSAVERSCDVQNNQCADAANASGNKNGFTVAACNQQQSQCQSANGA